MIKYIFAAISVSVLLFAGGNKTATLKIGEHTILRGININWSFLPPLTNKMIDAIVSLNPKIIRYPGGTVSKTWNWKKGVRSKDKKRVPHKLKDLLRVKKATNADIIFVLNTMTSSLANQLKLLRKAKNMGIPIKYIEIGNEHYLSGKKFQDNIKKFPTGKEYGKFANRWASKIKKEFPLAKIGLTMFSRTNSKKTRMKNWNTLVLENIASKNYDAFIYHIYLKFPNIAKLNSDKVKKIVEKRVLEFKKTMIHDKTKEIWITEYGVLANTLDKTIATTTELANYLDSIADISMVHVLYTKTKGYKNSKWRFFSLLSKPKAQTLTKLGTVFKNRYSKY